MALETNQAARAAYARLTTTGGRQPYGSLRPEFQLEDLDGDLPATSLDAPMFIACGSTYCDSGIALPTIDLIPGRL